MAIVPFEQKEFELRVTPKSEKFLIIRLKEPFERKFIKPSRRRETRVTTGGVPGQDSRN